MRTHVKNEHSLVRTLPCLVLCVIAATQFVLSHAGRLSAWKGGGFGMFATIDAPDMRVLSATARTDEGLECMLIVRDDDLLSLSGSRPVRQVATIPTRKGLAAIASAAAANEYVAYYESRTALLQEFLASNPHVRFPTHVSGEQIMLTRYRGESAQEVQLHRYRIQQLTLNLWGLTFDGESVRCRIVIPPVNVTR